MHSDTTDSASTSSSASATADLKALLKKHLPATIASLLSADSVEVAVKGKEPAQSNQDQTARRNIRPGIFSVELLDSDDDQIEIAFEIAHSPSLHIKPHDLLGYLQKSLEENYLKETDNHQSSSVWTWRVLRTKLFAAGRNEIFSL